MKMFVLGLLAGASLILLGVSLGVERRPQIISYSNGSCMSIANDGTIWWLHNDEGSWQWTKMPIIPSE